MVGGDDDLPHYFLVRARERKESFDDSRRPPFSKYCSWTWRCDRTRRASIPHEPSLSDRRSLGRFSSAENNDSTGASRSDTQINWWSRKGTPLMKELDDVADSCWTILDIGVSGMLTFTLFS